MGKKFSKILLTTAAVSAVAATAVYFFMQKKDSQDRMINAALKVFALQGYRHGSTDDIVREAAVSKGLLFSPPQRPEPHRSPL